MIPAGPPPMMQQVVASGLGWLGILQMSVAMGRGGVKVDGRLKVEGSAVLDSTHPVCARRDGSCEWVLSV
jgi:hypothetical protein